MKFRFEKMPGTNRNVKAIENEPLIVNEIVYWDKVQRGDRFWKCEYTRMPKEVEHMTRLDASGLNLRK